MGNRRINRKIRGQRAVDGAGVLLIRVFGYNDTREMDPFLMMDAFDSTDKEDYIKGFPWHPHRGIETVTYLIDGIIEHGDNMGNKGVIRGGETQWMTTGSGIIHSEMPKEADRLRGLQLWVNLPRKDKMTEPRYNGIEKDKVPVVEEDGAKVRVIAGNYRETKEAFQPSHVKINYLDVELEPNSVFSYKSDASLNKFIYVIEGRGTIEDERIEEQSCLLLSREDVTEVRSGIGGLRFILAEGEPLLEPIAWGGPIVMNTQEELSLAFKELENNTFIK